MLRSQILERPPDGRLPVADSGVTIRLADAVDHRALARLAELDSQPTPEGEVLLAEVDGELRAALPLDGGEAVADPFEPTAALIPLLRLRERQLRRGERRELRRLVPALGR